MKLNALKHVGNFAGETDIEQWLDRMELAIRIDGIPVENHADILALHLQGAAYDTWKGLSTASRQDAAAIKAELRKVFGMQRMEAWNRVVTLGRLAPCDTVDVAFEEVKKLVGIAAEGEDPIGRIAACIFATRLSPPVRDQVLLQCGVDMKPTAVVACAKQLRSVASDSPTIGLSAAASLPKTTDSATESRSDEPDSRRLTARKKGKGQSKCFRCDQRGHFARDCTAAMPAHHAVSGNGQAGQPPV